MVLTVPVPTDGAEPVAEPDPETTMPSTPTARIELFDEDPMSSTFMGEAYLSTEELLHPPWHDVSRPLCVKEADSSDETDKETEKANRVVQGTITISWCFEPLAVAELDPPEPPPGAEDTQDGPLHEVMFADDVDAERERLRPLAEKDKMFPVVNQLMATVEARARAAERGELVSDESAEGGRASVAGGSKGRILPEIQRGQLISMFERKMRLTILHGSPLRLVIPFHDRQDDDERAGDEHALVVECQQLGEQDKSFLYIISEEIRNAMAVIRARKNRETERQRVLALIRNEICANDAIESIQELCERAFEAAQLCLPEGSAFFVGAVQSPTGSKAGGLGLAPEPGPGSHSPEASSRGGCRSKHTFPPTCPYRSP